MTRDATISLHCEYLSKHKVPLYDAFNWNVIEGRRAGVHFWDVSGKRYFDCHVCGGVYNLGHRHPEVVEAVRGALDHLDVGNHHLMSEARARLARQIVASAGRSAEGEAMGRVVYAAGGGEAMDFAFKLARGYTGRNRIVCLDGGYHGHTGLAMGAGDDTYLAPWNCRPPHFHKVPFEHLLRIEDYLDADTAAVSLETVPATLGMTVIPKPVLQHIRRVTRDRGVLLILDEIQTGLGRTGRTWAFQHYDIMPDIFATAKGLSGGIYPMAAAVYRDELERVFEPNPLIHFSTFGGSEIGCAAAEVVLKKATDPDFLDHVMDMAAYFREAVAAIASRTNKVTGLRQLGLFQAIEFSDVATCIAAVARLNENGVFCVFANNDRICAQLMPPLIITRPEAEELMALVDRSIEEAQPFDLESSAFFRNQTESRVKSDARGL